jgi:hypothetical protein
MLKLKSDPILIIRVRKTLGFGAAPYTLQVQDSRTGEQFLLSDIRSLADFVTEHSDAIIPRRPTADGGY